MPVFSRAFEKSLRRALAIANEHRHKLSSLEHLLLALIDEADAAAVMRACNVDLELLRKNLLRYIDDKFQSLVLEDGDEAKATAGFQRVVQRAAIHVQSSGRNEVTGAHALVAIFAEPESRAANFLQEQDMTRYDAVNYISHGIAKRPGLSASNRSPRGVDEAGEHRVSLLNDEYTPTEFVLATLQTFFNKNLEEATQIMLHVHQEGVGECGVFPYEIAETKVAQVMDHARKNQHPLQCIMEKK
jgi:ATP-dependent Clp protease ATP-binding subunit ClpA